MVKTLQKAAKHKPKAHIISMNVNKQLNSYDVDWPVVNGETIDTAALKNKGLSIIINQFREVDMPYKINGMNVMIPVSMPIYEIRRLNLQDSVRACGGYTTVKFTKAGVNIIGEARCNASDHFNKSVGIKIATAKAVIELQKNGIL